MDELISYRQELLARLEEEINRLAEIIASLTSNRWHHKAEGTEYTPHYILAHLRELDSRVFTSQLPRLIDEEIPVLPVFDDRTWMNRYYQPKEQAQAIFEDFAMHRRSELDWLREMPTSNWSRTARHPRWGMHTLQWWVELQVDYSEPHLRELSGLLAM